MTTRNAGSEGFVWFLGIVEDTNDPLMLGRVRVRAFREHDQTIETDKLHWAISMMPTTSPSVTGIGVSPNNLLVGSYVFGFYLDGHEKQYPAVLATWHKIPDLDQAKSDVNKLARGENITRPTRLGPEPESPYAAQYPFNRVYQTQSGHIVEFDDTPNNERINIYHKSGSYVEINKDGRMVSKVMGDNYKIVVKDDQIHVNGNATLYVNGNDNITIKGNCNITVDGNCTITGKSSVSVNSSGPVRIRGSKIELN